MRWPWNRDMTARRLCTVLCLNWTGWTRWIGSAATMKSSRCWGDCVDERDSLCNMLRSLGFRAGIWCGGGYLHRFLEMRRLLVALGSRFRRGRGGAWLEGVFQDEEILEVSRFFLIWWGGRDFYYRVIQYHVWYLLQRYYSNMYLLATSEIYRVGHCDSIIMLSIRQYRLSI